MVDGQMDFVKQVDSGNDRIEQMVSIGSPTGQC